MGEKKTAEIAATTASQMLCHLLDQEQDNGAEILNLVERYVLHFAKRYCNLSFHEQQDIQQDVAVKLLCHGENVRANCSRSWIYTVVRNECINHVHKNNNQMSVYTFSDDPEAMASTRGGLPSIHPGSTIELIERIDCLQNIFNQIEVRDTGKADIAIYTQYAFGLSYEEISNRSRRTVAAIGNRISQLKKRLKKLVEKYC